MGNKGKIFKLEWIVEMYWYVSSSFLLYMANERKIVLIIKYICKLNIHLSGDYTWRHNSNAY